MSDEDFSINVIGFSVLAIFVGLLFLSTAPEITNGFIGGLLCGIGLGILLLIVFEWIIDKNEN